VIAYWRRWRAKRFIARGLEFLKKADFVGAVADLRRGVELSPNDLDALCYLGMALSIREPDDAVRVLNRALAIDPKHTGALYWLAEVQWIGGNAIAAGHLLQRMNEVAPGSSANLARAAFAFLDGGDNQSGTAALSAAVAMGAGTNSALELPQELRRAFYLHVLGRKEEALSLIKAVNDKGASNALASDRYPHPLSEQLMELQGVVAGRDIVIMGSGPSLSDLEKKLPRVGKQGAERLCFFGFNNVPVQERLLKDAVNRDVDLACMTAASVMELHASWISNFLTRNSPRGLFLTLADALPRDSSIAARIRSAARKVFYFASAGDHPPIPPDPLHFPPVNGLMCVLPLAMLGRPRAIFLFGCDGASPAGLREGSDVYYKQGSDEYGKQDVFNKRYSGWLERDTFFFNAQIETVLACLEVLHRVPIPPIYICNPSSAYRPFPRIDGEEFVRMIAAQGDN
jgi:hypothetical protein